MTIAEQVLADNPCRPRHFKPPPCAAVIREGPAKEALEGCRTRLLVTGTLFAAVFAIIALRVGEIVLFEGNTNEPGVGRSRVATAPTLSHADVVDRNGAVLAPPATVPIKVYPVRVQGSDVQVEF